MADNADIAQEQQEKLQQFQKHNDEYHKPSNRFCDECGVEIPEQRRKLGGVRLCIDCQNALEHASKHFYQSNC